jgi:hypothetical protein
MNEQNPAMTTAALAAQPAFYLARELAVHEPEAILPGAPIGAVADHQLEPDALFSSDEAKQFRARWDTIQAGFVDEPRRAVEEADTLVASAMQRLAFMFAAERAKLEGQWDRKESVSTEELRIALQREDPICLSPFT